MKTWQPDDGDGNDPFLGGLLSKRGEMIAAALLGAALAGVWFLFGLGAAAGTLFVIVLLWTLVFA